MFEKAFYGNNTIVDRESMLRKKYICLSGRPFGNGRYYFDNYYTLEDGTTNYIVTMHLFDLCTMDSLELVLYDENGDLLVFDDDFEYDSYALDFRLYAGISDEGEGEYITFKEVVEICVNLATPHGFVEMLANWSFDNEKFNIVFNESSETVDFWMLIRFKYMSESKNCLYIFTKGYACDSCSICNREITNWAIYDLNIIDSDDIDESDYTLFLKGISYVEGKLVIVLGYGCINISISRDGSVNISYLDKELDSLEVVSTNLLTQAAVFMLGND